MAKCICCGKECPDNETVCDDCRMWFEQKTKGNSKKRFVAVGIGVMAVLGIGAAAITDSGILKERMKTAGNSGNFDGNNSSGVIEILQTSDSGNVEQETLIAQPAVIGGKTVTIETSDPEMIPSEATMAETILSEMTMAETIPSEMTTAETMPSETTMAETMMPETVASEPITPETSVMVVEGDTSFYKDGTFVKKGDDILPESATQYLSEEDLSGLTLKGLCYAKNEIYARYGRKFQSQELTRYFSKQPWYHPVYEASSESDEKITALMNDYEYRNKDVISALEQKIGPYKVDTAEALSTDTTVTKTITKEVIPSVSDEVGIHTYEIFSFNGSWQEAFDACLQKGGYLLRINSEEEYECILESLDNLNFRDYRLYLGGRQDIASKQYYWVNESNNCYGESLNGLGKWCSGNWMVGEPSFHDDTLKMDETVMEMFFYSEENRWVWNDIPNNLQDYMSGSSKKIGYICEYEN